MSKRLTRRVLLLGWDAADWKIIHPLLDAGRMPVLQRLVEGGASGRISTLQPALSPILWNSIATGKRADKHGILGFMEPTPDGSGVRPVSSTSRRAKALWNMLSQNGLRSSVANWFASHPAEPIAGTIFSNRLASGALGPEGDLAPLASNAVHPPELLAIADDLRVHPAEISPRQLAIFFDRAHPPKDWSDPRIGMLVRSVAQTSTVHNAATWLAARDDWDLLAVYHDAIDHIGHGFIEYHLPAMPHVSSEDAATFGQVVTGMYRLQDRLLGTLVDLVGPDTTIVLTSDHGFYSDHLRPAVLEHFRDPRKKFGPEMNPVAWHRPHGVFVAAGPPIKRDELIHGASLLDLAPTVLTLLGLPVPDDMDGRALTRILTDEVTPERIDSYEPPHPGDGVWREVTADESDPFAARAALEQLAELGYLELPAEGDAVALVRNVERDRRSNLAQVLLSGGRTDEAIEITRGLLAEQDQLETRCRLALMLAGQNRADEAEEVMGALPGDGSKSPMPRFVLGEIRLMQGRLEEAQALFEPLVQQDFPLSHLHTALGQVYAGRGMLAEAEETLRRALARDDDNAEAHDRLGAVLRRLGRVEEAIYEHTRAIALQHARPATHVNLGVALVRAGQTDWAIRAFETALELAPKYLFAHRCLMHLYRRVKGDDARARWHFSRAVELRRATQAKHRSVSERVG